MRKKAFVFLVCLFFLFLFYIAVDWWTFLRRAPSMSWQQIEVENGMSLSHIAQILGTKGVISSTKKFIWLGRIFGTDRTIKAGEYRFPPFLRPGQILDILARGKTHLYSVLITEGATLEMVAGELLEVGVLKNTTDLMALAFDPEFLKSLGIEGASLEGYLYPETYHFEKNTEAAEIWKTMVGEFWKRFDPPLRVRAQELALSVPEVVTLASIIEREVMEPEEYPIVSAVFHNRLRRKMRLQADPTVIYGLPNFRGNITKRHLQTYTPYNTYIIKGLPPGPIGSASIRALRAALYPAPVNYLYFVSRKDGRHAFSTTLSEHQVNVRQYQIPKKEMRQ